MFLGFVYVYGKWILLKEEVFEQMLPEFRIVPDNKKIGELMMERQEKLKALDAALVQIEKQYGKGAVMKLGDPSAQMTWRQYPQAH